MKSGLSVRHSSEARKLGYETVIMPKVSAEGLENIKGIKIIGVSGIGEAIDII